MLIIFIVIAVAIAICVMSDNSKKKRDAELLALMDPGDREKLLADRKERQRQIHRTQQAALATSQFGALNSAMLCPHCQKPGKVRTKKITQKKGISGSKAAAAVVTGGLSVLAVGLARKEASTQAHCDNCNNTWLF